eukprot:NODE_1929_length_864_cov_528.339877_g1349_i0.p1 GENE.NODE_1929_length_864_cov_528.339877_g1349_i0~~NODE_1929_length_864_cov_528.339877_g1349_i0.p1  ORF type:complete len:214 (-),score=92.96 NODE_1929_length_864_cov_528.339877_g1349_i0:221-784(-)
MGAMMSACNDGGELWAEIFSAEDSEFGPDGLSTKQIQQVWDHYHSFDDDISQEKFGEMLDDIVKGLKEARARVSQKMADEKKKLEEDKKKAEAEKKPMTECVNAWLKSASEKWKGKSMESMLKMMQETMEKRMQTPQGRDEWAKELFTTLGGAEKKVNEANFKKGFNGALISSMIGSLWSNLESATV